MKLLIDTNILIDFVCHRDEFYEPARNVFATAFAGNNDLLLTDLSYMNCIYVAKHYGVDNTTLLNALQAIQKVCAMAKVNDDVMSSVLCSDWKDKEDALQYYAAVASQADGIVTRNPKDYKQSTIRIIQPSDL